tara:strand:+ start:699 stop:1037 length:339 start_codon:yes stop_codon:yes gene_type:complete
MFCFASFPIHEDIQFIDTVIVNKKIYEGVGVDSTSNYPLEKETLTQYRARLKKQLYSSSSEEKKYSLAVKVLFFIGILIVLFLILVIVAVNDTSTSTSGNSFDLNDILSGPK